MKTWLIIGVVRTADVKYKLVKQIKPERDSKPWPCSSNWAIKATRSLNRPQFILGFNWFHSCLSTTAMITVFKRTVVSGGVRLDFCRSLVFGLRPSPSGLLSRTAAGDRAYGGSLFFAVVGLSACSQLWCGTASHNFRNGQTGGLLCVNR